MEELDKINLQNSQRTQLLQMFQQIESFPWRIFILDSFSQEVIAPLFHVADLRQQNVTLHLNIDQTREKISEIAAVYLILPNKQHVQKIIEDCIKQLYDYIYIYFLHPVKSELLQELAMGLVKTQEHKRILKICDLYSDFITLEDKLFVLEPSHLNLSLSLGALNSVTDEMQLNTLLERISSGIYSVTRMLNIFPIFRARGEASERVLQQLKVLYKNTERTTDPFTRPLFVIVDRSFDMQSMLTHP